MLETKPTAGDTDWFVHDRFGLFIHWGIYSLPARHEWIKQYEEIPDQQYDRYFKYFDPDLYDPDLWAQKAAAAGMKYFVITTKHHDGFCLWDSALTDYKATNTPAGRDLLQPMIEAFRKQNMRVGLYHSLIDWHHDQFTIDDMHSIRNHPDRKKLNETRDQKKYIDYLHGQVRELLTQFGKVDIMWFDFSYPLGHGTEYPKNWIGKDHKDWDSENLYKMIRQLQPQIILNDRLDIDDAWDIKTPEQFQPRKWIEINGQPVVWEGCQTFSGSWGYHRDETSWKSIGQLVRMLIDIVSKGGNLILNVGPTGRGELDHRALDRLSDMGEWMKRHSRAIYGCTQAPPEFTCPQDCRLTYNPTTNRLYVHLFAWPFKHFYLDGKTYLDRVEYAQLLNDASEIPMAQDIFITHQDGGSADKDTVTLQLPVQKPNVTVPVIELFLK